MPALRDLGWNDLWEQEWKKLDVADCAASRVVEEQKGLYRVQGEGFRLWAEVSGRLHHLADERGDLPAVGDWVAIDARREEGRATIHHILPRRSKFSRKAAGRGAVEQIVAANVDFLFVVASLNRDLNVRRIERYLTLVWECGATPVVLLTKADLCEDAAPLVAQVESVALGVAVHVLSAVTGKGMGALTAYLRPGRTAALLGSSGVGKSTLINFLLGEDLLATREVRAGDDRGRHTTSARQLILLPGGGMLIDTPGMRELALWDSAEGLDHTFDDVATLATQCQFTDCWHSTEPGCAIQQAIGEGALAADRYESYLKLQKELDFMARKQDKALAAANEKKWRKIHMEQKRKYKSSDKF